MSKRVTSNSSENKYYTRQQLQKTMRVRLEQAYRAAFYGIRAPRVLDPPEIAKARSTVDAYDKRVLQKELRVQQIRQKKAAQLRLRADTLMVTDAEPRYVLAVIEQIEALS